MATKILSAPEIREIAGRTAAALLPLETAATLPVPVKPDGALQALIIYYRETGRPNQRTVHPPTHAMWIDAATGKVVRFGATTPEQLGIPQPVVPVPGVGIDPAMTGLEFIAKRDRFLDISRDVWAAYDAGSTSVDAATRDLVHEYWTLFSRITKAEVAPFYIGAANDFFAWVRAVAGAP